MMQPRSRWQGKQSRCLHLRIELRYRPGRDLCLTTVAPEPQAQNLASTLGEVARRSSVAAVNLRVSDHSS